MGNISTADTENKLKFTKISGFDSKETGIATTRENLITEASHGIIKASVFNTTESPIELKTEALIHLGF